MEKTTGEKIQDKALEMMAERGYRGTNLRDLATEVGLSKSALYRHFDSKESIWRALVKSLTCYYELHFGSARTVKKIPKSCEELKEMAMEMVDFTIHDKKIVLIRKVLLAEQFHFDEARSLATEHFNVGLESVFERIFTEMIKGEVLREGDPETMACAFTGPITTLIHLCDREPEKEKQVVEKIEKFIDYFIERNKA